MIELKGPLPAGPVRRVVQSSIDFTVKPQFIIITTTIVTYCFVKSNELQTLVYFKPPFFHNISLFRQIQPLLIFIIAIKKAIIVTVSKENHYL